jgi:hypothetical protein
MAVAAALAVSSGACGGDDEGDASDTDANASESGDDTTTSSEATTTTLTPEEAVWRDVVAGSDALSAVSAAPDPEAPDLLRYYTGESLAGLQDAMRDLQAGGAVDTSAELHRYSVAVAGETASADYCFVDTTQRLTTAGDPVGPPEVTSMRSTAQLELVDDVWKISQQTFTPEECPAS